ncbi:hypothetical protein [Microbulbifer taiwanensis]|uniref:hypothetical protein n=1 Tax=Microbulbifer taiwanensis TaxID=986746 RepID=UPI00361136A3
MRLLFSIVTSAGIAASLPAAAEGPEDGYFDLTPYISRVDKDRDTDRQAGGLRAAYGWGWSGPWYSEVQVFGAILETEDFAETQGFSDQTDYYMYGLGFDVVYNFGDRDGYTPTCWAAWAPSTTMYYRTATTPPAPLSMWPRASPPRRSPAAACACAAKCATCTTTLNRV